MPSGKIRSCVCRPKEKAMSDQPMVRNVAEWREAIPHFIDTDTEESDILSESEFFATMEQIEKERREEERTLTGHIERGQLVLHQPLPPSPPVKRLIIELEPAA
jgi:hypothetical protein